jgi:signal transduction histidine kinase
MDSFQARFQQREAEMEKDLDLTLQKVIREDVSEQWLNFDPNQGIFLYIFRNDSLLFWNSNRIPVLRFANIQFPADGVLRMQNGWYRIQTKSKMGYTVCAAFVIRSEYAYKNDALEHAFAPELDLPFQASIQLQEELGLPVYHHNGNYAFSVIPDQEQPFSKVESAWILLLFLTAFTLWLFVLFRAMQGWKLWAIFLTLGGLALLRFLSLHGDWFGFLAGIEALDPSLYATNFWLPNFFEYLLNTILIGFVLHFLAERSERIPASRGNWLPFVCYLLSFGFWWFLLLLIQTLIENASIPLAIDQLFSLNLYSLLTVTSLGFLFITYYRLASALLRTLRDRNTHGATLAVYIFIAGCTFFLYEISGGMQMLMAAVFPLCFNLLLLYIVYRQRQSHQLSLGILTLMLFSIALASTLAGLNERRERVERELYGSQLAMEKNITTEVEYAALAPKVKTDSYLQRLLTTRQAVHISDFEQNLESRLFNGFWERYEMKFYLFDSVNKSVTDAENSATESYEELQSIVQRSGTPSEIDPHVYLIHNHTKQYSYIFREIIEVGDSIRGTLFCTLKSKKIPEEIGFPRLLISSDANVLEPLEAYSIAKYHDGNLVTRYGSFNYPSSRHVFKPSLVEGKGFFDYREYNHYLLGGTENDTIVLSIKKTGLVDLVTSFSYLFSFFGLLLMPMLFRANSRESASKGMSLSMKIQIGLISLVFLSLLTFGWGSGLFVSTQYNQFTDDMIREKLRSVETEVASKLSRFDRLEIDENGNYMQSILQKFARVFFTDINVYDRNGYLLASSRPKVFNVGLLSEQMNPEAYKFMELYKQSEYVHQEAIGKLNFSSAYKPFYNAEGAQLGYINLQHFGQQREFENQIQRFLVAIINVFILLLAISVILAIFISNWLTAPLRILQENFARVKFGKFNDHIHYDREDEIGSLVKDYNQKLDELEFAAEQLARNEREMAWREMAKQVAHEIKNPLTPMKLSVQQLLRVYDPNDPKSMEKLQAVSNSIIEQIDALTRIANEFSTFGKMPNPSQEPLELITLVKGAMEVFRGQAELELHSEVAEIRVVADKVQFVRIFNNLIKNAIQATPREREPIIHIRLTVTDEKVRIELQDNGSGIPENEQSRIFVPYFTTKGTGTGLGLAMVKQIVENHRGTIDFESVLDQGTTFIIELPLA